MGGVARRSRHNAGVGGTSAPEEFPTLGASREQLRAAYTRYGARFEVDNDGKLTLRLDLDLAGYGVAERNNIWLRATPVAPRSWTSSP
jgi:hypothetical protein